MQMGTTSNRSTVRQYYLNREFMFTATDVEKECLLKYKKYLKFLLLLLKLIFPINARQVLKAKKHFCGLKVLNIFVCWQTSCIIFFTNTPEVS